MTGARLDDELREQEDARLRSRRRRGLMSCGFWRLPGLAASALESADLISSFWLNSVERKR